MSVNQCWASKTADEDVYDPALNQVSTSFFIKCKIKPLLKDQVLLWDEFCPEFPWVGPLWKNESTERKRRTAEETVDQYLGEYWLGSDGIQKIHFRQFAWVRFIFRQQSVLITVIHRVVGDNDVALLLTVV